LAPWRACSLRQGGVTTVNLLPADAASFRLAGDQPVEQGGQALRVVPLRQRAVRGSGCLACCCELPRHRTRTRPGTSELERGTAKAGASSCPSVATR